MSEIKSCYIAGPYTAPTQPRENANILNAAEVAAEYIKKGWACFCPHTHSAIIDQEFNKDKKITYYDWLTLDLYWLAKCDVVVFLPGWEESKGATIEHVAAKNQGKEICYLDESFMDGLRQKWMWGQTTPPLKQGASCGEDVNGR